MLTFVLVHGSWHDGSCWDRVIERLESLGHRTFAPTVAGHGKGAGKAITHAESTKSVVEFIEANDLAEIVLVGHSYGGTIICKAAEVLSARIRRLVFVSGFVLNDGQSVSEAIPLPLRVQFDRLATESADNTITLPFAVWREAFMNDADLELARACYDRLSPEPYQPITEPLDLKKFYALDIPRSYILGSEDVALPLHPIMTSRLGLYRFLQMPGGHELLFTNPYGLADKIIEAGRD